MNCHQNTEAADLLGGLRPLRAQDVLVKELRDRAKVFVERCARVGREGEDDICWTGDNLDVVGLMAAVQVNVSVESPCFSISSSTSAGCDLTSRCDVSSSLLKYNM